MNLSRWRTESQHADEDQGPSPGRHSDDEDDVPQQTSVKLNAATSVEDNQRTHGQPSTVPRVRVIDDVDDTDIWGEIENSQPAPALPQEHEQSQPNNEPDDLEDWFALDDGLAPSSAPKEILSVPDEEPLDFGGRGANTFTDEDIDALFAHMDETMAVAAQRPPLPTEEDFEDMYT